MNPNADPDPSAQPADGAPPGAPEGRPPRERFRKVVDLREFAQASFRGFAVQAAASAGFFCVGALLALVAGWRFPAFLITSVYFLLAVFLDAIKLYRAFTLSTSLATIPFKWIEEGGYTVPLRWVIPRGTVPHGIGMLLLLLANVFLDVLFLSHLIGFDAAIPR